MDTQIIPENDLVVIGVPLERVVMPEFIASRDSVISKLGRHYAGLIDMKGHRVDRNRDSLVAEFLKHPAKPDWLLFMDSDMSFPEDVGHRLMSARLPVIGGLYFHRSQHSPFMMTEYKETKDQWGRMRRSWRFERKVVDDFLSKAKLPMHDSAVIIDGIDGRIQECDAIGTGCMMIHRSVLEAMTPPWFEYREMAESEDLTFCWRVRHELGLPVHVDLGTICGHYRQVPLGHAQFRNSFRKRGYIGSSYDAVTAGGWLTDFLGIDDGLNMILNHDNSTLIDAWNDRGDVDDLDFYKSKEAGHAYLTDLIHWNESDLFNSFKADLIGIEHNNAVVIGSGIGTTAIQLALQECSVYAFEANDILREFSEKRWAWTKDVDNGKRHSPHGEIKWYGALSTGVSFPSFLVDNIDVAVVLDTFEHMPEKELVQMLNLLGVIMKKGGRILFHNNWGQQNVYPMHHDHSKIWERITEQAGFFQFGSRWLLKVVPFNYKVEEYSGPIDYERLYEGA